MRRRPTPEDIISTLLMEEGFYEVSRNTESTWLDNQIILSDGKLQIVVNILSEDSCNSKSIIHEALIETQKLQSKYDGVIIAVPRRYSKIVDESLLLKYGIGLIIYDMMGAEEVLPPKININRKEKIQNTQYSIEKSSITEIAILKSEIAKIMRMLEEMEARLDRLEKEQRILASKIIELERTNSSKDTEQELVKVTMSKLHSNSNDNLPSYLKDNPWLEILSKRV